MPSIFSNQLPPQLAAILQAQMLAQAQNGGAGQDRSPGFGAPVQHGGGGGMGGMGGGALNTPGSRGGAGGVFQSLANNPSQMMQLLKMIADQRGNGGSTNPFTGQAATTPYDFSTGIGDTGTGMSIDQMLAQGGGDW